MKRLRVALLLLPLMLTCFAQRLATAQSPDNAQAPKKNADIKLSVDLVIIDAQVMQQKTGRIIGDLKKEDFALSEDGVKQQITHFSQDTLPLSVILLVDRGGCLDPFNEKVRQATFDALSRLRPQDEVALMTFASNVDLIQRFGSDRERIRDALYRVPHHDEEAPHCFNRAFYSAAQYMRQAANPDGRRVIIMITALNRSFDCSGPSGEEVRNAVFESGSVVCGLIPTSAGQRIESGVIGTAAGLAGMFKVRTSSLKKLAEETGGEVMNSKAESMDIAFKNLVEHLRTRYSIGFVSSNTKRDGSFRKLKLEIASAPRKGDEKLVVKTRRGYLASRPTDSVDSRSR